MRKQPIELLTNEDIAAYSAYVERAVGKRPDVVRSLAVWNKNKKTLLKALNGQLRYIVPIDISKTVEQQRAAVYSKYSYIYFRNKREWDATIYRYKGRTDFPYLFIKHCVENYNADKELFVISNLFDFHNIIKGYINLYNPRKVFGIDVKPGAKVIKTISKLVKITHFPNLELFEKWRNQMSDITSTAKVKANLVISIHPLDFLSLSDNNSSWHSCYSILKEGIYRGATISHMNSNCAAVAYLESSTPFEVEGFRIPNKNFRQLFYIHKNIICGGRSYPNENEDLTKKIIDILQKLVYNNLGWTYEYPIAEYKDDLSFSCNSYITNEIGYRSYYLNRHRIILYVGDNAGYNDLIEHRDETFYCVRNWVPKDQYICVTGPTTCILCGDKSKKFRYHNHLSCAKHYKESYCDNCTHPLKKDEKPFKFIDILTEQKISACSYCLTTMTYIKELDGYTNTFWRVQYKMKELGLKEIHYIQADKYYNNEWEENDWSVYKCA